MVSCNVAEGRVVVGEVWEENNNTRKLLGSWEAQKTTLDLRSDTYSKPQSIPGGETKTHMQGQGQQQIEGKDTHTEE